MITWAFEMRREIGAATGIKRFDFGFSEEECIGVYGLEMMMIINSARDN